MKSVLFLSIALAFVLSACEDKSPEVTPTPTPVVVKPTPVPQTPTPEVFVAGEHCRAEGKKFYCGNPTWYGYSKCLENADGDIYFADYQALVDMMKAKDRGLCLNVRYKDGKEERVPSPFSAPGPCATCAEM
jgi:hypothetical protein